MIEALQSLGEVLLREFPFDDVIVENFSKKSLGENIGIYTIEFDVTGKFLGIINLEGWESGVSQFLIPNVAIVGAATPPYKFSPVFKTSNRDVRTEISNFIDQSILFFRGLPLLGKIGDGIESNRDEIIRGMHNVLSETKQCFVVFSIREKGERKFVGDFEEGKQRFSERILRYLLSKGKEGKCYLCGRSEKINGDVLRYAGWKFSTPDKSVFVPGINTASTMTYAFGLCEDCFKKVYTGAIVLRKYSRRIKFQNILFLIVPYFTDTSSREVKIIAKKMYRGSEIDGIIYFYDEGERKNEPIYTKENLKYSRTFDVIAYVVANSETKILARTVSIKPSSIIKLKKCFRDVFDKNSSTGSLLYPLRSVIIDSLGGFKQANEGTKSYATEKAVKLYFKLLQESKIRADLLRFFRIGFNSVFYGRNEESPARRLVRFVNYVRTTEKILKLESCYLGGDNMNLGELLETGLGKLAYETGKLAAAAMYVQRRKKGIKKGEEPFRSVVASTRVQSSREIVKLFVRAWEKILQYGEDPSDYTAYKKEDLNKVGNKLSPDILTFAFALGIVDGEREVKQNGSE